MRCNGLSLINSALHSSFTKLLRFTPIDLKHSVSIAPIRCDRSTVSMNHAQLRNAPLRNASLRIVPLRIAPLRIAPLRNASMLHCASYAPLRNDPI